MKRPVEGEKISTPVGQARVKKVQNHKKRQDIAYFTIECPRGCGNCVWTLQDVRNGGFWMCPYCKKENPIFKDSQKLDKLKAEIRKEIAISPKRADIHNTTSWKKLRYFVLKRDGGKCVLCGRCPKDGVKLHVDHIKPASLYPELYYDIDNLQTLCEDCNLGKSNLDDTSFIS